MKIYTLKTAPVALENYHSSTKIYKSINIEALEKEIKENDLGQQLISYDDNKNVFRVYNLTSISPEEAQALNLNHDFFYNLLTTCTHLGMDNSFSTLPPQVRSSKEYAEYLLKEPFTDPHAIDNTANLERPYKPVIRFLTFNSNLGIVFKISTCKFISCNVFIDLLKQFKATPSDKIKLII